MPRNGWKALENKMDRVLKLLEAKTGAAAGKGNDGVGHRGRHGTGGVQGEEDEYTEFLGGWVVITASRQRERGA